MTQLNRRSFSNKRRRNSSKRHRGGSIVAAAATALLPFGFLALEDYVRKGQKKIGGASSRRARRR